MAHKSKLLSKLHQEKLRASCLVTVGTEFDQTYQKEMLRLVNNLRKEKGLKPLQYAYSIQAASDLRAQEAWANKDMGHMRYTNKHKKTMHSFFILFIKNLLPLPSCRKQLVITA